MILLLNTFILKANFFFCLILLQSTVTVLWSLWQSIEKYLTLSVLISHSCYTYIVIQGQCTHIIVNV